MTPIVTVIEPKKSIIEVNKKDQNKDLKKSKKALA